MPQNFRYTILLALMEKNLTPLEQSFTVGPSWHQTPNPTLLIRLNKTTYFILATKMKLFHTGKHVNEAKEIFLFMKYMLPFS